MKKILLASLTIVFLICTSLLVACGHVCSWDSQIYYDATGHYQKCTDPECKLVNVVQEHEWESEYSFDGLKHYYKCADENCGQINSLQNHEYSVEFDDNVKPYTANKVCQCGHKIEFDFTTVTPQTAQHTINNIYDATIIKLTFGEYQTLRVSSKSDVIIYAGEHVKVELIILEGECKNISIYDIPFNREGDPNTYGKAGVKLENGSIDGLVIKNCSFKNNAGILTDIWDKYKSNNVLVEDCTFNNIDRCSYNGWRTAIVFYNISGITVQGCSFDTVERGAIEVNVHDASQLVIKNNTFKAIGGRVLHLGVYSTETLVEISNNVFYQELCTTNPNTYITHDTGAYINGKSVQITVGANIWEVMPENIVKYFRNVSINMAEQVLLQE